MADGVGIRIEGTGEAFRVLDGVARRATNPLLLWKNVGEQLLANVQERFLTGTGPDGAVWPQSLRARMEGGRTLTDSARLMQSLSPNYSGSVNATEDGVEIGTSVTALGTNVLYAAVHQFGATITAKTSKGLRFKVGRGRDAKWATKQSVTIPARPFLGIDREDEQDIIAIATDWLSGEAADAG